MSFPIYAHQLTSYLPIYLQVFDKTGKNKSQQQTTPTYILKYSRGFGNA